VNPLFKRLAFAATAVALAALGPAATSSGATFPGKNGLMAYEAKIGKRYQLFTSKADGTAPQQLTHFADSDAVWAAWSPSGNRIAFEREVYTGVRVTRAAIYTMNPDGSGLRSLTPTGLNGRPSWSPDGKLIVFSTLRFGKEATISVMAANRGRIRKVLTTPLPTTHFGLGLDSATFSPDGKRIAFVWTKTSGSAIFTMKASGGGLKQVTPWQKGGLADKIDWSPDGARIAFSSPGIGDRPGISANVFTVRPDGSGRVKITNSRGGRIHNGLDSWSPDGKKIAFVSNRTGTFEIFVMNANGRGVRQITRGPEAHHASWGTHP
jgi:Tol biopolymer transport system component